ncbi:uncharacterized protein [Rutidosis leptorrhynchoides]|uniref:uncharacterized protein isoform X2 n=1 Tax=Rutidosis leptorrhynchoides TaxID=125765 RepID=UPI003A99D33F
MKEDQTSIESQIQQAMRARSQHFRDQAESVSFVGVRRLLEQDLGLDTYALDVHKKYVKQLLEKYLSGTEDDDNVSKGSEQKKSKEVKVEEDEQLKEQPVTEDVAKVENSSQMELLSENEIAKSVKSENSGAAVDKIPTEVMIKDALWNKATYFRSKSEELTMASVRRIVEEELKLDKFSLDSFKKLISKQLDEILNSENEAPNKTGVDFGSDKLDSQVKPKKKLVPKAKLKKTEELKKLKRPAQEADRTKKKKIKTSEQTSSEKNNVSESGDESESHAKKSVKGLQVYQ